MAKLLFIPVSITAGLLAGLVGKKIFNGLWGVIDKEEPPDSKHRDISWPKLLLAGAIQGAIFRAVKEATDHGSRRAFYRTTGARHNALPIRALLRMRKIERCLAFPVVRAHG
jgi:hypothetical protein